ncbi:precorrin-3B C(17)-methyltransferase [Kitasatospora sp. NPDC056138]|uniref:precorrin-3B C(17)-methyltransferase n=1 Tax=Kitasatospora sp. NPDC056138 TaxID=3345724 RepID=UPI0035D9C42C
MSSTGLLKGCAVLLLAAALAGCGDLPATDGSAAPENTPAASASPTPEGFCPPPEAQGATTPGPCISYSQEQRFAENHAYARVMPLATGVQAAAQPRVQALTAALEQLAGKPIDETRLRAAVATATGVKPFAVTVTAFDPNDPVNATVVVELANGCLHGDIAGPRAAAEITGFIADGGCVPAVGH